MALFPCVVGNHKYTGPQQSAYCAALNGSFAARSKLRLCPEHIEQLGQWLNDHLKLIAIGEKMVEDTWSGADKCYECQSVDIKWQLFANLYRRGEPQLDFYAASCPAHIDQYVAQTRLEL